MTQSTARMLRCFAIALVALLSVSQAPAADLKIAFLDEQTAILDTERARIFRKELEDELKSELEEVRELNGDLQDLQKKITRDRDIMSDEERQRLISSARTKGTKGEKLAESIREIQQQRLQVLFQNVREDFAAVVNDVIEDGNYDAVFRLTSQNVFFVHKDRDITAKVTEKLNARLARN